MFADVRVCGTAMACADVCLGVHACPLASVPASACVHADASLFLRFHVDPQSEIGSVDFFIFLDWS